MIYVRAHGAPLPFAHAQAEQSSDLFKSPISDVVVGDTLPQLGGERAHVVQVVL